MPHHPRTLITPKSHDSRAEFPYKGFRVRFGNRQSAVSEVNGVTVHRVKLGECCSRSNQVFSTATVEDAIDWIQRHIDHEMLLDILK